jgi:hypothetical protein
MEGSSAWTLDGSKKLKGAENWTQWKNSIEQILIAADLDEYVDGSTPEPSARPPPFPSTSTDPLGLDASTIQIAAAAQAHAEQIRKWKKGNAKAYIIIQKNVIGEAHDLVSSTSVAATAWRLLTDQYEGKGFFLMATLWQEFQELSFSDSKDVGAYNARFKELRRKIEAAGLKLPGQLYVIVYLQQVHATYPVWTERQRSYLRKYTAEELQGLKISYKTLENMMTDLVDESRVLNMQNENFNSNANGTALYGNRPPPPARGRGRNGHRKPTDMRTAADTDQNTDCNATQPSGKRHCNHCSKDGHMEDKCWIKNPSLRPKGHKKKDNAGGGALLGSTLFSSYSVTPIGHNSSDWILDTGASHHMCNDRQMFDGP